ncbi:hypothetical protein PoB_002153200 [Plakobranchus ocellatus]|uniref:Transmembrane protein n=1 Tax=Plakobranchus ocellatus TaxID=259542 RepID=A0AAV3ZI84_9GAST|nr:hypothetical protein PoB_002153200 [Plakobranchus ocellatus]
MAQIRPQRLGHQNYADSNAQSEVFIPETHVIDLDFELEDTKSHFDMDCKKRENHALYRQLKDLTVEDLPMSWRDEGVLQDLKDIGTRVVHLTVLKLSPSRQEHKETSSQTSQSSQSHSSSHVTVSHEGSGFLTFNKKFGPLVHTSKHVVCDRFEAEHTVVRVFYDDDRATHTTFATLRWLRDNLHNSVATQLPFQIPLQRSDSKGYPQEKSSDPLLFTADGHYFESFIYSDYTVFSCDIRISDHFPKKNQNHPSFSYVRAGNKQLVLGRQLDVAIISHPHGVSKAIAFGKMKPLARLLPAMYDASTCPGSSGAPFIRLHTNTSFNSPTATIFTETISTSCEGQHFVSAGLFVHHGFYPRRLKLGMGTVRPPITLSLPAKRSGKSLICWIVNTFSLCEDFLLYWMLLMFDQQQVEPFIKDNLPTFMHIVPLAGVIFSLNADLLRVLWTGFWMHITCSVLYWIVQGPHITPVVCGSISAMFSILMFVTGWILLQLIPQPWNFCAISGLWWLALQIESKYSFHKWFFDWFIKTFRAGKLIPIENHGETRTPESPSFSSTSSEEDNRSKCESLAQVKIERLSGNSV